MRERPGAARRLAVAARSRVGGEVWSRPDPAAASLAIRTAPVLVRLELALNRASDEAVRADRAALPAHLDRADGYLEESVIGGETANVADLQIAASVRLLTTIDDLRGDIEPRPCGRLALRLFPDYPGRMPNGSAGSG